MDIDSWRAVITVLSFLLFIGIVWWAYSRGNKDRFEDAGKLPFEEDDVPAQQGDKK
jgi:cytochrome c oxidase cbb3-type subunit 4